MKDSRLYVALMHNSIRLDYLTSSQRSSQVRKRLEVLSVYVGLAGFCIEDADTIPFHQMVGFKKSDFREEVSNRA